MFFRPNYCANCGEKIVRAHWGILTSRRFCQVCESEYKGQDLIPRFIVGLGVLLALFGLGGYLKSSAEVPNFRASALQPRHLVENKVVAQQPARSDKQPGSLGTASDKEVVGSEKDAQTSSPTFKQVPQPVVRTVSSEPSYICGAETKKGTPCSRRVKANTRCFQHSGMPSMLAADESKIGGKR